MTKCLLDNCCFCIELRTGCLIIAYLQLVGEIILIALGITGLVAGSVIAAQGEDKQTQDSGAAILVVAVLMLLVVFFLFAFTVVLLVGLHQGRRGHVKAYLIYAVIFIVLSIIMFFASFAGTVTASNIIRDIVNILLSIYFVLVIRSYYYKMDEKRPAVYNTA